MNYRLRAFIKMQHSPEGTLAKALFLCQKEMLKANHEEKIWELLYRLISILTIV
jgi:hypothetical protein